ncbi:hypothetical protein HY490_01835 [Candidatus Woesearchaeota archaeon]|nr:hypothetical protein [Candidatus Woesearchaeota archaeon]
MRNVLTMRNILNNLIALSATVPAALAHCPLCTAATGAAVVTARFYGVPDSVVGVLIGTFALVTGLWVHNAMKKRGWVFIPAQAWVLSLASVVLTVVSLHVGKLFAAPVLLWGMPALLAGILLGSGMAGIAEGAHRVVRSHTGNRNLVPLQGLIAVMAAMTVSVVVLGVTT